MGEENCFELLKDIKRLKDTVQFRDDSRLTELYKMTVAGDRDRIKAAKSRLTAAEQDYECWSNKVDLSKKRLTTAEDDLYKIKKICEQLQNVVISSCSDRQDIEEIKAAIAKNKTLLRLYKEMTGVHFSFDSPSPVVAGFVGVKGSTPSESKLRPFVFDDQSINQLQADLWKKILEVVNDKA